MLEYKLLDGVGHEHDDRGARCVRQCVGQVREHVRADKRRTSNCHESGDLLARRLVRRRRAGDEKHGDACSFDVALVVVAAEARDRVVDGKRRKGMLIEETVLVLRD